MVSIGVRSFLAYGAPRGPSSEDHVLGRKNLGLPRCFHAIGSLGHARPWADLPRQEFKPCTITLNTQEDLRCY